MTTSTRASLHETWHARGIDPRELADQALTETRPMGPDGATQTMTTMGREAAAQAAQVATTPWSGVMGPQPGGVAGRTGEHAGAAGGPGSPPGDAASPVELGEVLGAGAMGVVRAARQRALRRDVAVKRVRGEGLGGAAESALLREAWTAARLEHPNIIPIHTLHFDEAGPNLVMKRIEGTVWTEVLGDAALARRFHAGEPLEFHLDVLMSVCRAVHFAHTRGVVHLDLKPDNVMLGAFGEVYVLDWGLAASFGDERVPWTRHVDEIRSVCGTPGYVAPEQAAGEGERFGPATDVYLLGAVLHQIVTGEPLHTADTVLGALLHAYESPQVEYGADVSPELRGILHQATAREPAERFQSADELRKALEAHLGHRSSDELTREALRRLATVRTWLSQDAAAASGIIQTADEASIQRAVSECRFGFQHALRVWPANEAALAGLQELLTLVIHRAARRGDWAQAVAALDDLPRPDDALTQIVEDLRQRFRQDRVAASELRALRRDLDLDTQRSARFLLALRLGPFWLAWNVLSGLLFRSDAVDFGYPALFASGAASVAVFLVGRKTMARALLEARVDRHAMWLLGASIFSAITLWAMCAVLGLPVISAAGLTIAIEVFFLFALAAVIDRRTAWTVPAALPFGVFLAYFPDYAFEVNGLLGLMGSWALAWVWRRPDRSSAGP